MLLFLLLFTHTAKGGTQDHGRILSIPSSNEISVQLDSNDPTQPGELLLIRSQDRKEILGYAEVISVDSSKSSILARVRSHASNALIRINDEVERIDLTDSDRSKDQMKQGRHDLVVRGNKRISAKYKPQVYLGALAGQTAATLEETEVFLGPGLIAYGINETLQVSTQPFLNALGEANFHVKWQFFQNEDYRISLGAESRFNLDHKRSIGSASLYWDTFSNSKFLTYNQLRITTGESELHERRTSAEFSVNYGYITNRWNRILFGPSIDFREETLGGLLSFQWVWDRFTSAFTIQARDFTKMEFGSEGYLLYLDFWWRF